MSRVEYSTVRYSTVQYGTVQYGTVQYGTVQYSTVQYSTVQYSTVYYSTVQYSTVQQREVHRSRAKQRRVQSPIVMSQQEMHVSLCAEDGWTKVSQESIETDGQTGRDWEFKQRERVTDRLTEIDVEGHFNFLFVGKVLDPFRFCSRRRFFSFLLSLFHKYRIIKCHFNGFTNILPYPYSYSALRYIVCADVSAGRDLKSLPFSAFEWPLDLPIPHLVRT